MELKAVTSLRFEQMSKASAANCSWYNGSFFRKVEKQKENNVLKELSKACLDELRSDQLANGTQESF